MSGVALLLLRESREGAREGRQWELTGGKLTVGREEGCDIHLRSQSIDNQHAVFEWSAKSEAHTVRDLGSVNATYVNGRPLRATTAVLRPGDSIRFGYEKSRIFRIEVKASPPSLPSPASHASPASQHPQGAVLSAPSASTQTSSPLEPVYSTTTAAHQVPVSVQFVAGHPHAIIVPTPIQTTPQAPPTISQYYIPPGYSYPPAMLPPHNPNMAFQPFSPAQTTPTGILQQTAIGHALYPSLTTPTNVPPLALQSQQQQQQATFGHAHYPGLTTPTAFSHLTVEDLEPPTTKQQPLESSSPPTSSSRRKDGRRAVPSPSKANASTLYGQPSWWGEEETSSEPELDLMDHRSQILRDFTRNLRPYELEDVSPSPSPSSSSTNLLRKKAFSNSRDSVSPSSSLLDFTAPAKRTKPPTLLSNRRPRSADPSPVRSSSVRRSKSPSCNVAVATTRKRLGSQPSENVSPRSTPVIRKPLGGHVTRKSAKPLSDASRRDNPPVAGSETPLSHVTGHVSRRSASMGAVKKPNARKPPRPSSKVKIMTPEKISESSKIKKETDTKPLAASESSPNIQYSEAPIPTPNPVSKSEQPQNTTFTCDYRNDQTYTTNLSSEGSQSGSAELSGTASVSDTSLATPTSRFRPPKRSRSEVKGQLEGGGRGGRRDETFTKRPNSARKQWNTDTPQAPDSLMLASIEARMRRLTKLAETSAALVSSSSSSSFLLQQRASAEGETRRRGGETGGGAAARSGDNSAPLEDSLPEWKFFNKEVDSIFHSIRAVEKWLQDINSNVTEMRTVGVSVGVANATPAPKEGVGVVAAEGAELESCDSQEEGVFVDSIEEHYYSCSDSEGGRGEGSSPPVPP